MRYIIEYTNGKTFLWQPRIKSKDQLEYVKSVILSSTDVKSITEM